MTIFVVLVLLVIVVGFLSVTALVTRYLHNRFSEKKITDETNLKVQLTWESKYLLVVAFFLIFTCFFLPVIFTQPSITKDFDFSHTGEIGDTISGLMNPFIGLASVLVTGLAFYMQYKANLLQRDIFNSQLKIEKERFDIQFKAQENQIRKQQFEAQFYEMLRLHKENINELELDAFRLSGVTFEPYLITKRNAFVELKAEFEFILSKQKEIETLDRNNFKTCYSIFFSGLGNQESNKEKKGLKETLHEFKEYQYDTRSHYSKEAKFHISAFRGHSEFLGHYYRHLFHTVKFVVSQEGNLLDYDEVRKYLRILRAQISNHEQIMVFYNWLANYGAAWENEKNRFFTEYVMIHNIWYDLLFDDPLILKSIDNLRKKPFFKRKGPIFEIDK